MGKRVLLLGARGFVGSHFRVHAEEADYEVVGASRRQGQVELTADLLNPRSLERAIHDASPDLVVNLAGEASAAESWRAPRRALEVNAVGVLNLLEAASRQAPEARVLCVSSGDAYGLVADDLLPVDEDAQLQPASPYGASKAAMEVICGHYARRGLRIAIARAFNHTGPGQSDRFALSNFAKQIAAAEGDGSTELRLRVGDLDLARDFTDVRDTVRAYLMMLEAKVERTLNVCSGRAVVLRDLVAMLSAATSVAVEPAVDEQRLRPQEAGTLVGSNARLTRETGWKPEIELGRTARDLLDHWRKKVSR